MLDLDLTMITRLRARNTPDQPCLVSPSLALNYAEFDRATNRVAQGLIRLGIAPGERVGCLSRHSEDCLLLQVGANKMGAVNMPVNWRLAPRELEYILSAGELRYLIADATFLPALDSIGLSNGGERIVCVHVSGPAAGADSFRAWYGAQPDDDPGHHPDWEDTALQLGSSGTTGRPKLIELSFRNIMLQCRDGGIVCPAGGLGWRDLAGLTSIFLNVMPNFHVSGTINAIGTLYREGLSVFQPEFDPAQFVAAIARHGVTETFMVPAMMRAILDLPHAGALHLPTLRRICYGGAPISESLLRQVLARFRCEIAQVYGMTELCGTLTCLGPEAHVAAANGGNLLRSAGRPIRGAALRIVDPATLQDVPPGGVGEIWARAPHSMKGYFKDKPATEAAFPEGRDIDGGWYRSGDLGYLHDGYLFIHDRLRDMIVSGGENIYPAEVENQLAAHEAVADCAVIGRPDEKWGEAVHAVVVAKPGASLTESDIIAFMRASLAHYKCPKSIEFVEALPRNPTGKILRRVLRDRYWSGHERYVN